jgi:hypothetical protein
MDVLPKESAGWKENSFSNRLAKNSEDRNKEWICRTITPGGTSNKPRDSKLVSNTLKTGLRFFYWKKSLWLTAF